MPRKTFISGRQTPLGRSEMSEAIHPLASGLPVSSENAYHPRQFGVHVGDPASVICRQIWCVAATMAQVFIFILSRDKEPLSHPSRLTRRASRRHFLDSLRTRRDSAWGRLGKQSLLSRNRTVGSRHNHPDAQLAWFKWCFAEFTQARALGKPIFPIIEVPSDGTLISPDIQTLDLRSDRAGGLECLSRELTQIALDAQGGFSWDGRRPPYPGLLAFQEEDAAVSLWPQ